MPSKATGLTALKVKNAKAGRHGDGDGLYLEVKPAGARYWTFLYKLEGGKKREMGLGRAGSDAQAFTLVEARAKASALWKLVRSGVDPLEKRDADALAEKAAALDAAAKMRTFKDAATLFIASHEAGWKNAKHAAQWASTLAAYAFPLFGEIAVGAIDTNHVLGALEPVWFTRPETAARLRGRIENVLDYAKSRGWREGENPARWRGHLSNLLPARAKVAAVEHHAALPWQEIGAFMRIIRGRGDVSARALEFTILTAARTNEAIGATWSEISFEDKAWMVPAERMKAKREHRVPLSDAALAVLRLMAPLQPESDTAGMAPVFPGGKPGKPLSNMAMLELLRRMAQDDITVHGFRSSFRDWVGEATATPREVAEAALAHVVGNKAEAAYARSDLFEKRRSLMQAWASFCGRPAESADVIDLAAVRAG